MPLKRTRSLFKPNTLVVVHVPVLNFHIYFRVLRPPGGGSSDIFGSGSVGHTTDAQQEQRQNAQKAAAGSNIFGVAVNDPDDQSGVKHISRKQQPSSQSAIFGDAPTASDLKKRNQEGKQLK